MSSPTKLSSTSNSEYGKRELDLIPFNSQLEVIEGALLNQSKMQSNTNHTNQYVNTHRYGYNNGSNNHKNIHNQIQNQNQQNKYALAAVAAAAAVQHQQGHLLHQSNRNSYSQPQPQVHTQPRQYNDYSPYLYTPQKVGLDKLGEHGDMSNTSLLSENNSSVPYDFQNTFMTSNGNNNSSSSPTTVSSNQPLPMDLQPQQSQPQPQFQNLTHASKPGFMFDPMNSDNISNSPTSLNPQHSASSIKTNKNSPPNLFMSTPNLPQPAVNTSSTSAATTNNYLNSPSLLPSVNGISNNWANANTNTKTINHSSIWGANPSLSSSNLDSNSGNSISLGNNFNGSMW